MASLSIQEVAQIVEARKVKWSVKQGESSIKLCGGRDGDNPTDPPMVATATTAGVVLHHKDKNTEYIAGMKTYAFGVSARIGGKRKHALDLCDNGTVIAKLNDNTTQIIARDSGTVMVRNTTPETKSRPTAISITNCDLTANRQGVVEFAHRANYPEFQSYMRCVGPDGKCTEFKYSHQTGTYIVTVGNVVVETPAQSSPIVQPSLDDLL